MVDRLWGQAGIPALISGLLIAEPGLADNPLEMKLCPPRIVDTCFIGYVTSASQIFVLYSSTDNDPLVGQAVEVDVSLPAAPAKVLDLSPQIGSVVMLDASGQGRIYAAKLVSDPLLTALYISTFLQVHPESASPQ